MFRVLRTFQTLNKVPKFYQSIAPTPTEAVQKKIDQIQESQPFFDRFVFFDPDVMASLPWFLESFEPVVSFGSNVLLQLHSYDIPWVGVLGLTCLFSRCTLLPLIYLQMKRSTRLATVIPAISQMKKLIDKSNYKKTKKIITNIQVAYNIVKQQKLKWMRLFLYNVFHIPMLVTLIWSIRRLLVDESFKSTSFLWIPSLSGIDPYYIIPTLTVACYYFNLQRFITQENQNTMPSKLRGIGQFLLILWLPFLSNWPAAISLYMCFNAIVSVLQTSLMIRPSVQQYIDPQIFLYQIILRMIEYDKNQSQALINSIKTAEESHEDKAITEEVLLTQFNKVLIDLEEEELQEQKQKMDNQDPKVF